MRLIKTIAGVKTNLALKNSQSVGLVPTMGALHAAHASLIRRARTENDIVVVSIFVNPLQFAPTEDLQQYPRHLEADCQLCQNLGVDIVFAPQPETMGVAQTNSITTHSTTTVVPPQSMTSVLCGKSRPGHFTGVATVVTKLFQIISPQRAYFGQKDAQQLAIIRRLVADLNLPVQIVPCPIVREASGLAYSSRNRYLSAREKQQALVLSRSLKQAQQAFAQGETDSSKLINLVQQEFAQVPVELEYVEIVEPDSLLSLSKIENAALLALAARIGSTRLIDNVTLQQRKPIIAIDGPAGAGKSTVTRRVAKKLNLLYLDTGAMYRAVTWLVLNANVDPQDDASIAQLVQQNLDLQLVAPTSLDQPTSVYVNGQVVTAAIRTPAVTAQVSTIAAQSAVRQALVQLQQQWGQAGGVVAEGRDIGTNVFPDAEVKIFLTATVAERARRRWQELLQAGHTDISLDHLEAQIAARDQQDSNRAIAPLVKADDAVEIVTDDLTVEQVVDQIIGLYQQKIEA